ncbi:MAG: carboxypeptidase-like regulatory domain-containing protein, partial [Bacteroidales bacterium]
MGIKELNLWTCSDMNGKYIIKNIPAGAYTMQASCLGFEIYSQSFTVPVTGQYIIKMVTTSLALDEVVVVAKEGKKITSTTTINASTLEHIQPSDLTDIMQLIPGNISSNPNLNDPKQLAIREIISSRSSVDEMASLGTSLIIDGAPVSNDANMQVSSTTSASMGTLTSNFSSSATGGVDARNISVDNIESVEVVRGVASAEQGDALSGVVKVNLKKGYTPLTAKVKVDPNIKQFYLGKGINLPMERGALNFDFDVTKSLDDARFPYETFYR